MKQGGPLKRKESMRDSYMRRLNGLPEKERQAKLAKLNRKSSLRDSFAKKLKAEATTFSWNRSGEIKRNRPLKKQSQSQRNRLKSYYPIQIEFLERPENHLCQICTRRREAGEDIPVNRATEVHHLRGRSGSLLCDERGFMASCYPCREWPHANGRKAREIGVLAPASLWHVPFDR